MRWLPQALLPRSAVFAVFGAPVMAGVHATAYALRGSLRDPQIPWIVGSAVLLSLLIPITLRATLYAVGRSRELAALPIFHSLVFIWSGARGAGQRSRRGRRRAHCGTV